MSEKINPEEKNAANDIAQLIQLGRDQGFLTHADINDTLPEGSTDEDNFPEILQALKDMGIKVFEETPDEDELMLGEDEDTDDLAAEDAVAALSQTEIESGRTTDPVRMYMREMGSVDLLTKTGEIEVFVDCKSTFILTLLTSYLTLHAHVSIDVDPLFYCKYAYIHIQNCCLKSICKSILLFISYTPLDKTRFVKTRSP